MKPSFWARLVRHRGLIPYCIESLVILTMVKLQLLLLPYSKWRFQSACFQCETLKNNRPEVAQIQAIARAISGVARTLPWQAKCLDQAIAADYMLTRRKLPSTLYLGMAKNETAQWIAHAWVRCGNEWVVGYRPHDHFTVVGTYARMP